MHSPPRAPADRRAAAFRIARWIVPIVGAVLLAVGGVGAVGKSQDDGPRSWANAESVAIYGAMVVAYALLTWAVRGLRHPGRGRRARVSSAAVEALVVGFAAAPAIALTAFLVAWFAGPRP
jgi:hypothetical protein